MPRLKLVRDIEDSSTLQATKSPRLNQKIETECEIVDVASTNTLHLIISIMPFGYSWSSHYQYSCENVMLFSRCSTY